MTPYFTSRISRYRYRHRRSGGGVARDLPGAAHGVGRDRLEGADRRPVGGGGAERCALRTREALPCLWSRPQISRPASPATPFAAAAARRADAAAAAAAAAGPLPASGLLRRKPLSERARAKEAREALVQASARRPSDGAAARLPSRAYPHLQPPELAEAAGGGLPLPPSPLHLPPLLHLASSILSTDAKPPFLIDLIGACLEPHPAHRPTVHDLLGSSHFALDARALLYAKRTSSQLVRNSFAVPSRIDAIL